MASVRSIAKQTGVSVATVSRVMNDPDSVQDDTRKRVLAAMEEADYRPKVRKQSVNTILVGYTEEANFSCDFDSALMQGMMDHMDSLRFDLLVQSHLRSNWTAETFTAMCRSKGVAGVLLRTTHDGLDWCERSLPDSLPILRLGGPDLGDHIQGVDCPSGPATEEAVRHLIHLGHTRIGFVHNLIMDHDHEERLKAYRSAMTQAGLPVRAEWELPMYALRTAAAQVISRVLSMQDPVTALVIADPVLASGTLLEARRAGIRVPEELSIVGMDDAEMRFNVYPTLTSVCQNTYGIGKAAVQWMMKRVSAPEEPNPLPRVDPAWFEIHDSCAAPSEAFLGATR